MPNSGLLNKDGIAEGQAKKVEVTLPEGMTINPSQGEGLVGCSPAGYAREAIDSKPGEGCPEAAKIGTVRIATPLLGVGSTLTYVPGKVYLAGPYRGSPLSIAAITAAKVGPFDLGTVVVREALRIDPDTAEVFVDPTGSDPIPHIIQGIPVHAATSASTSTSRTSCPTRPAANGARPRPRPRLRPTLRMNGIGEAAISRAAVTLPHSEFLDQSHIRTVCTRVQFKAGAGNGSQCPKGAVYGYARAWTPLLDEPITGPVYLRSSDHPLPDLVAALEGTKININLVGRIDSVGNGRIRNTFEAVPDAPVGKFVLCRGRHQAGAVFEGHNGKQRVLPPAFKCDC